MAQRDQGMRMLINHEQDEEDDDDDDDVMRRMMGMMMRRMMMMMMRVLRMRMMRVRMKMKMRMMTLYQPEISPQGGSGGPGGIEPWPAGVGGLESFRVSNGPAPCLFLAKARAILASAASFREKQKQQDLKPYLPRVFQHQHVQTPTPIFLNCKTQVPMMQQT